MSVCVCVCVRDDMKLWGVRHLRTFGSQRNGRERNACKQSAFTTRLTRAEYGSSEREKLQMVGE